MSLSAAQLPAYKADILANTNQAVIDALAAGANNAITDWYNLDASPDYFIFKNMVTSDEIRAVINAKNLVDITAADLDRVEALLNIRADLGFSGAVADDRAAWDDVFSAATGDQSQQAIAALWARVATNIEAVYALSTGTGADAANADTTSFQGDVTLQNTRDALALP
jgi:hypothetical protein